ncbi:hypothetical protein [Brevibacillus fortis]|uniref:Uncharacterized protein n=1 Tax=Brevibacillus fortis TaxID=2126352 RepID=A0A2P7UEZ7_9BACL|nr:hypothetical protein [Brevibacillus fortis]PSJ85542.1 hypothetical protein C7R93_29670 [Brevibacillus fortis]
MSILPFIIAIIVLVLIGLVATIKIGINPTESKERGFKQRSRNLLIIYGIITIALVIALSVFLYNNL